MMPPRATYTVEEAAARLGIGRTLARRLARAGQFPGLIRLGTRYLVSRQAIEDLVASSSPGQPRHGNEPASDEH